MIFRKLSRHRANRGSFWSNVRRGFRQQQEGLYLEVSMQERSPCWLAWDYDIISQKTWLYWWHPIVLPELLTLVGWLWTLRGQVGSNWKPTVRMPKFWVNLKLLIESFKPPSYLSASPRHSGLTQFRTAPRVRYPGMYRFESGSRNRQLAY